MKTFFDLLIATSLAASIIPAFFLLKNLKKGGNFECKYRNITITLASTLIIGALMILYGSFIEPRRLVINDQAISIENISKPIKIAFISDLHAGPYKQTAYFEKIVDTIIVQNPDIVLLGGDQVDNLSLNTDETIYLTPLKKLADKIPTYAINGNHEYGVSDGESFYNPKKRLADVSDNVKNKLSEMGIKYLNNTLEEIKIKNTPFYIFGAEDYYSGKLNYSALNSRTSSIPTIVLVHEPVAAYDLAGYNIDLQLSGHTHGGQIRLPFIGPLKKIDSKTTPTTWYKGLNKYKDMQIFTSSGVGETGIRSRLFNPPEIVILNLEPKKR